jgi:hypothetical protein
LGRRGREHNALRIPYVLQQLSSSSAAIPLFSNAHTLIRLDHPAAQRAVCSKRQFTTCF